MLYIVHAYLMLFAALTNSVCLNNASFFFLFKYFLCQGYELSGEIALTKKKKPLLAAEWGVHFSIWWADRNVPCEVWTHQLGSFS